MASALQRALRIIVPNPGKLKELLTWRKRPSCKIHHEIVAPAPVFTSWAESWQYRSSQVELFRPGGQLCLGLSGLSKTSAGMSNQNKVEMWWNRGIRRTSLFIGFFADSGQSIEDECDQKVKFHTECFTVYIEHVNLFAESTRRWRRGESRTNWLGHFPKLCRPWGRF